MDIAVLTAVVAIWSLIQGAVLLSRWNSFPDAPDLWWSGVGIVLVGLGSGLFAARYFGLSYILASFFANMIVLTGLSFMVQGVRSFDGFAARPILLVGPALLWALASSSPAFRASHFAGLWLFCPLAVALSSIPIIQLARGGLQLRAHRMLLGLWMLIAGAMASKIIDAPSVVPGLVDRFAFSAWHLVFLILSVIAVAALGYVNLALANSLETVDAIARALESRLGALCGPTRKLQTGPICEPQFIWSLRLDRLVVSQGPRNNLIDSVIDEIASAISDECPGIIHIQRLGFDRIIWITTLRTENYVGKLSALVAHINAIILDPKFPCMNLTCGATRLRNDDLPGAAASADLHAALLRARYGGGD
ncbi:hypothetical protein ACFONL_11210 [Camelimonas fluminis]|uniref:GGDEF domain-containing protein n=1 Tax=Camelimonas fluminis TaxID=1576911 RepID=A0ABV7UGV2_9HYPH|nr:hypothetical protein [Camelimonas fluminis]